MVDVLIFGGQSNMQGQTEGLPEVNVPVAGAYEYRYLTDSLIPVAHPIGEDLENGTILGAHEGGGSLVPDCCRAYIEATGREVIAIHTARGATTVSEWQKGQPRYELMIKKISAGLKKIRKQYEIGKIYFLWLQGESDAIALTTKENYSKMVIDLKNSLKSDVGIDKFCIIEVGYFCGLVTWLHDRTIEEGKLHDEAIMKAQEELPTIDSDFVMLTQICKTLSLDKTNINPFAQGHYNNKTMTVIGETAGKALAEI